MDAEKDIHALIKQAIKESVHFAGLKELSLISVTCPKDKRFGDFSTNAALVLGQKLNKSSLEVAQDISSKLNKKLERPDLAKRFEKIEVKGGFINFFLSKACLYELLLKIRKEAGNFGRSSLGRGERVHIEFVSANPTGPLNVAHARQAAFGDTLARILEFSGYKVFREYYLNDEGVQIDALGSSLGARYLELLGKPAEFPASGYRGKYIDQLAEDLVQKYGHKFERQNKTNRAYFSSFAVGAILKDIKKDLADFEVNFDSWFSQRRLNKAGKITKALNLLKKKGFLYQKEGAWWLASSRFGDDNDRVVIKSDSNLTYIAPDIAYHATKFKRSFSRMLNIWGPDHHGYIPRLKAAISALGYDTGNISFLIVQLVSLSSQDKYIPMSTRLGQYVSLADIVHAVGKDAARFFFLMRKRDSHLHFDLELAKKQSLENPVYYVQYAHARCLNILKFAKAGKRRRINSKKLDLSKLGQPQELKLIQRLREFPVAIEHCLKTLEPHRMTIYLQDLAKDFHHYYERYRVVTEDIDTTCARLALVDATRIVLNNGLGLLAVQAPEKM